MGLKDSMGGENKLRVLFVAICYEPGNLPSDKQFLNDLIQCLPNSIVPAVWTLTESIPGNETVHIGDKFVPISSICRVGHRPIRNKGEVKPIHPKHPFFWQLFEIASSVLYESSRSLRRAVYKHRTQVIHFVDNVGPIIQFFNARFPTIPIICSKPSARVQGSYYWWLYKKLLSVTYSSANKIVTYTDTSRDLIVAAGIPPNKVATIPWGVKTPSPISLASIEAIHRRYGCKKNSLFVVALPRGPKHFICKMIALSKSLAAELPIRFVFAIRPTLHSADYDIMINDNVIVENGPADFYDLLAAADVAFAPQERQFVATLPPLAWLEAMARGTPLITMTNPGIDECVIDGETGLLYQHSKQIKGLLQKCQDRSFLHMMAFNAQSLITQRFNVRAIAIRYASLWESIIAEHVNKNNFK